ncbi:hypothetical protein BSIN_0477 [Burkholderia singularis]|uniref:Uncharacterized protein n=1 Tax=Burkholderia singularis TaxID=1503053 RepID=A0A238H725_9BURK|nr:hypothetical protein BSIN_0477 [Burkholderia singularis]
MISDAKREQAIFKHPRNSSSINLDFFGVWSMPGRRVYCRIASVRHEYRFIFDGALG